MPVPDADLATLQNFVPPLSLGAARRIACQLIEDGWVPDARHYDGPADAVTDLAAVIQRAGNAGP